MQKESGLFFFAAHLGTELNACPCYWPRKKGKIEKPFQYRKSRIASTAIRLVLLKERQTTQSQQ